MKKTTTIKHVTERVRMSRALVKPCPGYVIYPELLITGNILKNAGILPGMKVAIQAQTNGTITIKPLNDES